MPKTNSVVQTLLLALLVGCGSQATPSRPTELPPLPTVTVVGAVTTQVVPTTAADVIATAPPGAIDPYAYDPNATFLIPVEPPPTPPPAAPQPQAPVAQPQAQPPPQARECDRRCRREERRREREEKKDHPKD